MNGRPLKYINVDSTIKVLDLIPEDGTCIRFKELKKKCREHVITHRILLRDLKRLEDTGTVVKEAVKTERGAGTCYRRTVFFHSLPPVLGGFLFSWDDVPGEHSEPLLNLLKEETGIDFENAKILKTDSDRTICILKDENSAEIMLNENKEKATKATLKISDGRTYELQVKKVNSGLDIHRGETQAFSGFISGLKAHVESCKKESCAAKAVHNALYVLFLTVYDELVEYIENPNKELAEKRLSSVLKDFILPIVMKTTELAALPGACSEKAQKALDCAHAKSLKDWDKIWECAASIKGDYDNVTLKKTLEELEKVSPNEEEHKSNPDST